ncbi:MAG: MBL fold metallo-hydrolase [Armatimonadota bacterium]|nr:MAG: MBL fold metallo-hydrolase [Armatimonadota bacterium]
MISAYEFEDVTIIRMGRDNPGGVIYWTAGCLVDGLLIDTGCAHISQELLAFLADKRVEVIVNTHYHEDHVGANRALQDKRGLRIYAHRESVPLIGLRPELSRYRREVWGIPDASDAMPTPDTINTQSREFRVIETPGHCRGHIALFEQSAGHVFSGDLYVTPTPKGARPEEDVGQLVRDMRGLAELEGERLVLFTGVGSVVEDGRAALRDCASGLEHLIAVSKQLEADGLSPAEIRDRILGDETPLAALTDGDFSAENLIRSALRAET